MRNPLLSGKEILSELEHKLENAGFGSRNKSLVLAILLLLVFGLALRLFDAQPAFYAHADTSGGNIPRKIESPLLAEKPQLFGKDKKSGAQAGSAASGSFAEKLYGIVGDAPIREMIPLIAERDQKVAAFLVGIAKKESGFGRRSPWKDGEICYNFWGYKGSAGRGKALGHACFASAEEAVEIVGNRIEVLINKNRTTPAIMVHTWKCGTSCAGDPGAPSWVSTVAAVFEEIMS